MAKIKTLQVSNGWQLIDDREGDRTYRVEKVTDSVEVSPGDWLTTRDVQAFCEAKFWKVTVVAKPVLR